MASTNSDSLIWVVGEATGRNGLGGTALAPSEAYGGVFFATNTTVPTAAPFGYNAHVTSDGDRYEWNGDEWVGPYVTT